MLPLQVERDLVESLYIDTFLQEVFRLLEHVIQPSQGPVYPLKEAVEAVKFAQQPGQKDRVLLASWQAKV